MDRRRFLHMSIAALAAACSSGPSGLDSVVGPSGLADAHGPDPRRYPSHDAWNSADTSEPSAGEDAGYPDSFRFS